ncbi:glutathione S-transferase family protein [Photobacterium sp. OFAV2-7]|uniref:glutathione S-transferase family protein n=1 Tax=Photobacterium sp. OFAV2-7 TaxID=2917748 RepID=UPI001EF65DA3|nr:glutathione S-transferase family protein [Photobacterium sp. OFAV2-7]MCG7585781.1 glutathione S-transferase family protein [Photobacterium sp. OFAV2-7]
MKLYFNPMSLYSMKVLIAFQEKQVDVEHSIVNLMDEEERSAFREIYPIGKVPLLMIDDYMIPESTIIIEYLEGHYPKQGTTLIPDGVDASRKVRFLDRINDLYLINQVGSLFFASLKPEAEQNQAELDKTKHTLGILLGKMNKELADREWLAGDNFTMADCSAIPALALATKVYPFAEQYPEVAAYLERAMQRPSVKSVVENAKATMAKVFAK